MNEWLGENTKRAHPFIREDSTLSPLLVDAQFTAPEPAKEAWVATVNLTGFADSATLNSSGQGPIYASSQDLIDAADDEDDNLIPYLFDLSTGWLSELTAEELSLMEIDENARVRIEDGSGTKRFDTDSDPHLFTYFVYEDHILYQWWDAEYVVRLVFAKENLSSTSWPQSPNQQLVPSSVFHQPPQLFEVSVNGTPMDPEEPIILAEGFNSTIEQQDAVQVDGQPNQSVVLGFEPGAGQGRYDDCQSQALHVQRINGLEPDKLGNFYFQTGDCLYFMPYRPDDTTSGLEMLTYCNPCCTCDEMVTTYEGIRFVLDDQQKKIPPKLYNARIFLIDVIEAFKLMADWEPGSSEVFI
jgi:hypothetical protein